MLGITVLPWYLKILNIFNNVYDNICQVQSKILFGSQTTWESNDIFTGSLKTLKSQIH